MKLSQLIEQLDLLYSHLGDVDVYVDADGSTTLATGAEVMDSDFGKDLEGNVIINW